MTASSTTSLSVLVPVFNERYLVVESLKRLRILDSSPLLSRVEVIVVDDCSTDGTSDVLRQFLATTGTDRIRWHFVRHEKNEGKGGAIRTGLAHASCEITVVHDADLEYHPADLLKIVRVFIDEGADAVFGSRFVGSEHRRVLMYRHELGNRFLTFLCNLVTNLNLTDMETCYKAVRTGLLKSIPLVSRDFRIEPELTIKLAKRQARIFEVPIRYSGRTYLEGKKIGWRDGARALAAIGRFTLSDDIYREDEFGSRILARLSRAPRFNAWMADTIRGLCGERVLEIGGGVGNLTLQLIPRSTFVVSDVNPLYLQTLQNLIPDRPYLSVRYCDVTEMSTFPDDEGPFDTIICLNVIEHINDHRRALENIRSVLAPSGNVIVLVPHGPWNFGTLDDVLGHVRRYTPETLRSVAQESGLRVVDLRYFNRVGTIAWWLNGRILRRRSFGLVQIKILNLVVPLMRLAERFTWLPSLSLIGVLTHADPGGPAETPPVPRTVTVPSDAG